MPLPPLPPLFINMDETSLAYAYPNIRGTVVVRKSLPPGMTYKRQAHTLGDLRGHVTYMSFVCSDSAVQPLLPQILIGNEHYFTFKALAEVAALPANIHLWRAKSAWSNHAQLRRALSCLNLSLRAWAQRAFHNVILVLDVHKSHLHRSISVLARSYGFQIMYAAPSVIQRSKNVAGLHVLFMANTLMCYVVFSLLEQHVRFRLE
jgi:hypothetical protein